MKARGEEHFEKERKNSFTKNAGEANSSSSGSANPNTEFKGIKPKNYQGYQDYISVDCIKTTFSHDYHILKSYDLSSDNSIARNKREHQFLKGVYGKYSRFCYLGGRIRLSFGLSQIHSGFCSSEYGM